MVQLTLIKKAIKSNSSSSSLYRSTPPRPRPSYSRSLAPPPPPINRPVQHLSRPLHPILPHHVQSKQLQFRYLELKAIKNFGKSSWMDSRTGKTRWGNQFKP